MLKRCVRCCAPSLQHSSSFSVARRKSTKSSDPDVMRRLIAARHAAKGFLPTPVDAAVLQDVLEMTRRSPSSFNSQPWCCVIVQDAAQRERLAAAMLGGNTFKVHVAYDSFHTKCSSNAIQVTSNQVCSSKVRVLHLLAVHSRIRSAALH
jgi:nitroreductase